MKNIQITADWILSNFHHTGGYHVDGTGTIYCDSDDIKWNVIALEGVLYEYSETDQNEVNEFEASFRFRLADIKEIAPKFYENAMDINNRNKQAKINRIIK
jgi:hypothetical protein